LTNPTIGLALGGGAARGLAHIEILHALDDLGIRPAAIAGCSIGALVGAAYAAGKSAAEIEDHARTVLANPGKALRHIVDKTQGSMFSLLKVGGFGSLQLSGIEIVNLSLPPGVPELMEDLPIPFKTVATDFFAIEQVVFEKGPVVPAVAASLAIPGIIAGPEINGRTLIDGGMTNPVPSDLLPSHIAITTAIDVTGKPSRGKRSKPSNMNLAIGGMIIAFHQIAALKRAANPPDIYIEPAVEGFQAHEFFKLDDILMAARPSRDQFKQELEDAMEARVKSAG
jgi:NTE family protein